MNTRHYPHRPLPRAARRPVPAAVFQPPAPQQQPDPAAWPPNDKHTVLEFLAPGSPRALALAGLTEVLPCSN